VIGDLLLGVVRLAHALAAALWVGGALIFVLAPALARGIGGQDGRRLRESLRLGVGIFILTGAIMAAERLGSAPVPPTYVMVLGTKVAIAAWMFVIARSMGSATSERIDRSRALLLGGVAVYALAIALRTIYEHALRV
jgi:hypothetical protein